MFYSNCCYNKYKNISLSELANQTKIWSNKNMGGGKEGGILLIMKTIMHIKNITQHMKSELKKKLLQNGCLGNGP